MGCSGSKTADELTADLWTLINKKLTKWDSPSAAEGMLSGGANIRAQENGKYMIEEVREQEKRNRQANRSHEADNCAKVARLLETRASSLLVEAVTQGKLSDVQLLSTRLGGDLHQSSGFGLLGLLSVALKSTAASVELVRFLVENHPSNKAAIGAAVTNQKPPQPLHKQASDPAIRDYLLGQLNATLLALPSTVPAGKGNEGAESNRLVEQAESLITSGANPTVTDAQGNNVLCITVIFGHVPLARRLLHLGVDSTYVNPSTGLSVLALAESQSQRDPVLIALLKGHTFNLQFQQKLVKMSEEKECEYDTWHEEFQKLLTTGADIHCLNSNQDTPLHLLVLSLSKLENQEDDARFIKMFLSDFHADPNRYNNANLRPLEYAVLHDKSLRVLQELLDAPNSLWNERLKVSVLAFAKNAPASEHKDATIHLIQGFLNRKLWGAVLKCNKRGKNHDKLAEEIRSLLGLGAEVNTRTGDDEHLGYTPLGLICQQGDLFLVRAMISQFGANPTVAANFEGMENNYPLHLAAEAGQLATVQYLRSLALDMNVLNARKESALHLAARNGHVRVVKYLVLWGCNTAFKSENGLSALEEAQNGANAQAGTKGAQHALVISFLNRCEVAEVCSEPASIIVQASPEVDVCPIVKLVIPGGLQPTGPQDEDPLGEKSRGLIKGKPNDNLKSACKKGGLGDAKLAVSEGADVRHSFDGKSAYAIALASRDENLREKSKADYKAKWDFEQRANACESVANYLAEVATTKLTEAVEQGNEARLVAYHLVAGKLDYLAKRAAASTGSVAVMHYLVANCENNMRGLWSGFDGPAATHSPYALAKSRKFDGVAAYIQAQLSGEIVRAVASNNLPHVRECVEAGGLPDAENVENVGVAVQSGNVELVRFLLDSGARIPASRFPTVQSIESDAAIAADMKWLLRQRFLDRAIRTEASRGNFKELVAAHQMGADLCANNFQGATALSLSLQYTHSPVVAHYIVTRGGTVLHTQNGVPSAIPLSRSPGHPPNSKLEAFLKHSLNFALHTAIMDGDIATAGALCALGAEVNTVDETGNSLVHSAISFQGFDVVKWLVERGAPLNVPNEAGEYAITSATLKGDAASVELIVKSNPGTKTLKNSNGQTALELAKQMRFNKMVQIMDPGNPDFPVGAEDEVSQEPTQEPEELLRAAAYGQLDVIKIFIEEKYASLSRKSQICGEMVRTAESKNQSEVLRILVPHFKSLTSEAASDQTSDRLVSASAEQKKILAGFLTGLSGLIAGGEVNLDPSDPATYQQLFTNMSNKVGAQTEFLAKNVNNPAEVAKNVSKESMDLSAKMQKLEQEMRAMADSKATMVKRLQAQEAQLLACKTASAKKECWKEVQEMKDQLNTLNSSVSLFARAAEAATKKKKTLESLKSQPNLLVAYSTIENRLQGLFLACKSATAGMMSMEMTDQGANRMKVVNIISGLSELIPIIGSTLSKVVSVGVGTLVSRMDKSRQQQEIANITTLGNIEELEKAASNAAALVTFYYSAQINSVVSSGDKKAENAVPTLAEYLVLFMIKSLQRGEVVPGMDLATQLWFAVASQDVIAPQSLTDRLLGGPGDMVVNLKGGSADSKPTVTLRALFGSVGVMDANNQLYVPQSKALTEVQKTKKEFVPFYSISYVSAFTNHAQVQSIIVRRGLVPAAESESKVFLTSSARLTSEEAALLQGTISLFKDEAAEGAVIPAGSATSSAGAGAGSIGGDVNRVSLQVHDVLNSKGLVVSRDQVKEIVEQLQTESAIAIETDVDALREELNAKHNQYQTSIDAATETIKTETDKLKAEHRAVQLELNRSYAKQLSDQATAFAKQQAQQNKAQEDRLAEISARHEAHISSMQKTMTEQYTALQASHSAAIAKIQQDANDKISKIEQEADGKIKVIVDAQKAAFDKLVSTSAQAQTDSASAKTTCEQAAAAASASLEKASKASEQWNADLVAKQAAFDASLKTSNEQSAKTIADYKGQLDGMKTAAQESAKAAKESQSSAADTLKQSKELRELQAKDNALAKETREKELKALKEQAASESKALLSQAKDAESNASKAADASRNAEKAAKKAQEEATECKEKISKLEAKLNK